MIIRYVGRECLAQHSKRRLVMMVPPPAAGLVVRRRLAFAAVPSVQWAPEPWRMHTRHREEETR